MDTCAPVGRVVARRVTGRVSGLVHTWVCLVPADLKGTDPSNNE